MRISALLVAACASGCATPERTYLLHLTDMPPFEGGRVPADCQLSPDQQREMQGWEHRCAVLSQDQASQAIESYAQALRDRGWTEGGLAGSAMWILIPSDRDCAQVYSVVASDYPRGATTTASSDVVLDFFLEQRLRCGDERTLS